MRLFAEEGGKSPDACSVFLCTKKKRSKNPTSQMLEFTQQFWHVSENANIDGLVGSYHCYKGFSLCLLTFLAMPLVKILCLKLLVHGYIIVLISLQRTSPLKYKHSSCLPFLRRYSTVVLARDERI